MSEARCPRSPLRLPARFFLWEWIAPSAISFALCATPTYAFPPLKPLTPSAQSSLWATAIRRISSDLYPWCCRKPQTKKTPSTPALISFSVFKMCEANPLATAKTAASKRVRKAAKAVMVKAAALAATLKLRTAARKSPNPRPKRTICTKRKKRQT